MLLRLIQTAASSLQAAWRLPATTCRTLVTTTSSLTHQLTGMAPLWPWAELLTPTSVVSVPVQTYKTPAAIRKRCAACYIVRRKGRLYVECKLKPRHKQMQRMSRRKLYSED